MLNKSRWSQRAALLAAILLITFGGGNTLLADDEPVTTTLPAPVAEVAPPLVEEVQPDEATAPGAEQPAAPEPAEDSPASEPASEAVPVLLSDESAFQGKAYWGSEEVAEMQSENRLAWWPDLGWSTLCWFGLVACLVVTLRPRRLMCWQNLDALVLAGMCVLLAFRDTPGTPEGCVHTWHWSAGLGLTMAVGYWLLRGVLAIVAKRVSQPAETPSTGTLIVLLIVGLALAAHEIRVAPVSVASHDGLVGGLYMAETGELPYGDANWASRRSPLVYMAHAGAIGLTPAEVEIASGGTNTEMTWTNRGEWLESNWALSADLIPIRVVNVVLFLASVLGVCVLGCALRSGHGGLLMASLFCVFPGTLDCVNQPDVMLPVALVTWAIVLSLLRGVGGLLGMMMLVLAGVAWPWAWLLLPVFLAHFLRRGWQLLGGIVGLACGIALVVLGLLHFVQPTLPRTNAALHLAGLPSEYTVKVVDGQTLKVDKIEPPIEVTSTAWTGRLWRMLVEKDQTPLNGGADVAFDLPTGVNRSELLYTRLQPTDEARPLLRDAYRAELATKTGMQRLLPAVRTVLEETWVPRYPAEPRVVGTWKLWEGPAEESEEEPHSLWMARRLTKLGAGLVTLLAALAIFMGRRGRPRHLAGALLASVAAIMAASSAGAMTNLVWVFPLVAGLWVMQDDPEDAAAGAAKPAAARSSVAPPPISATEPPPRITMED